MLPTTTTSWELIVAAQRSLQMFRDLLQLSAQLSSAALEGPSSRSARLGLANRLGLSALVERVGELGGHFQ